MLALLAAADAWTTALVLAVIQGITEFLPISSDGHLVIAQALLERTDLGVTFVVALHLGTLAAVVWAYRRDLRRLCADVLAGRFALLGWLVLATLPAAVFGLAFRSWLERAFRSPAMAGAGLLVTAAALFVGERARSRHADAGGDEPELPLRWGDALLMGCAQAAAILPGVSRSGSTIAVGLARGIPAAHAARLSFLMSVPAVAGACVLELPEALEHGFTGLGLGVVAAAVLVSALVGWLALRFLLLMLARGAFRWFAIYCTLVGTLVLAFLRSP